MCMSDAEIRNKMLKGPLSGKSRTVLIVSLRIWWHALHGLVLWGGGGGGVIHDSINGTDPILKSPNIQ